AGHGTDVFVHVHEAGHLRLPVHDPPVHGRHRDGDAVSEQETGMSRRQLLRHAGWFGGAVVLTVAGGEVVSRVVDDHRHHGAAAADTGALHFVQVSDSHIGFSGPANTDVAGSFTHAIEKINALPNRPAFVVHTGDLTHLSTAAQFDQVRQMTSALKTDQVFTVPGEH